MPREASSILLSWGASKGAEFILTGSSLVREQTYTPARDLASTYFVAGALSERAGSNTYRLDIDVPSAGRVLETCAGSIIWYRASVRLG